MKKSMKDLDERKDIYQEINKSKKDEKWLRKIVEILGLIED